MAFRSSAITSSATGGNLTATPSGVAAHDYLLGWFTRDGNHGAPTYPSGWTQRGSNTDTTPDGQDCFTFDKDDATGSDSFLVTDANTNQSALITSAYTGRDNSAPRSATPVVTSNTASNTSPISATLTGITALAGDDIAVMIMTDQTVGADRWNASTISGYTQQRDGVAVDWVSGFGLQTKDNVGGGATGNFSLTWTRTTGTGNAGYRAIVHAIKAGSSTSAAWRRVSTAGPGSHPGPRNFLPVPRGFPVAAGTSAIQGAAVHATISAAQIAGSGALLASAISGATAAAQLAGSGSLAGASVSGVVAAGNLKGTANAAGAAIAAAIGAGQIQGAGALLGAAVTATLAAGVAQGAGALQGAAVSQVTAAGVLADFSPANLVGASVVGAFAAGQLSATGALLGASVSTATAAGQLSATGILVGAAVAGSFAAGLLSAQDAGAITASSVSFTVAAGVLITLTPAIPDANVGGGKGRVFSQRQYEDRMLDALTRDMEFDNPAYTPHRDVPRETSVEPPRVFTAEMTAELSALLAAVETRRRRALALLLLMALTDD